MTDTNPESFDIAAWISGAKLPEQAATVYQRADLIGALNDLERRIETEAAEAPDETPISGSPLIRKYRKLVDEFTNSALTFYVRALDTDEQREISAALGDKADKEDIGAATIARAIVGVQRPGSEREPVTLTADQVKALQRSIGAVQAQGIFHAWTKATRQLPTVDADFLRKHSGQGSGAE